MIYIRWENTINSGAPPFPLLNVQDFNGSVLESEPELLEPDQSMTPYVTDVTSDGLISLGFPEPMTTSSETFSDPAKVALAKARRVLGETYLIEKEDGS